MKLIISENQYKQICELERTWDEVEDEEQFDRVKDRLVPKVMKLFKSYGKTKEGKILLFGGKDGEVLISYHPESKILYYDRSISELFEKILPHPIWYVHGKFLIYESFKKFFPDYEVKRVYSANIAIY